MQSSFNSFIPVHPLLREHIAYIYFDSSPRDDFYKKYSFFPHVYTALTFYRQARFSMCEPFEIVHDPAAPLIKLLTRQHSIKTVVQRGKLEKIGIAFKPLGLNHFITEEYRQLAGSEVQLFNPVNDQQWNESLYYFFTQKDEMKKLELIETFLLSLFLPRPHTRLQAILKELAAPQNTASISTIATNHGIGHRRLNREFNKHLSITPELFRIITRFRHAIDQKIIHHTNISLTELAYESGYNDQAFMIRTFKKLTNCAPRDFFKKGDCLGALGVFWHLKGTTPVA